MVGLSRHETVLRYRSVVHHVSVEVDPRVEPWLALVVLARTGVVYHHQCGGHACLQEQAEGFLVPLSPYDDREESSLHFPDALDRLFHGRPRGRSDDGHDPSDVMHMCGIDGAGWPRAAIEALAAIVTNIAAPRHGEIARTSPRLSLAPARIRELVEGWVPVDSPFGPAVLAFRNCD